MLVAYLTWDFDLQRDLCHHYLSQKNMIWLKGQKPGWTGGEMNQSYPGQLTLIGLKIKETHCKRYFSHILTKTKMATKTHVRSKISSNDFISLFLDPPSEELRYCNVLLHWLHHSAMVVASQPTHGSFDKSFVPKVHPGNLNLHYT